MTRAWRGMKLTLSREGEGGRDAAMNNGGCLSKFLKYTTIAYWLRHQGMGTMFIPTFGITIVTNFLLCLLLCLLDTIPRG